MSEKREIPLQQSAPPAFQIPVEPGRYPSPHPLNPSSPVITYLTRSQGKDTSRINIQPVPRFLAEIRATSAGADASRRIRGKGMQPSIGSRTIPSFRRPRHNRFTPSTGRI
jgi:hypothetical protein